MKATLRQNASQVDSNVIYFQDRQIYEILKNLRSRQYSMSVIDHVKGGRREKGGKIKHNIHQKLFYSVNMP